MSTMTDFDKACDTIRAHVEDWGEMLLADDVVMCLSDDSGRYFRHDVLPTYKHNRDYSKRPILYDQLRKFMTDNWRTIKRPGLEADDVCGILSTSEVIVKGKKIVVSVDKDFLTIPGYLFNPNYPNFGVQEITEIEADAAHMMQTLVGDGTDGYKGCWKVGEKGANEIVWGTGIGECLIPRDQYLRRMWDAVVGAFTLSAIKYPNRPEACEPMKDALRQARVARILRRDDYNFATKEVKLWSPPRLPQLEGLFPLWKFKSAGTITNI